MSNTLALLQAFGDPASIEALKKDFRDNFDKMWKGTEAKYCAENKRAPVMTTEMAAEVMRYLDMCATPFHIKVLTEMVLTNCQLPNSYKDLDGEAQKLMTKALT